MRKKEKSTVEFVIRNMPPSLRKALKSKANDEDKTLNGLIIELLNNAVPEHKNKTEQPEVK